MFEKYDDEKFFSLFMEAVKETYSDYCKIKAQEEGLVDYSEPTFEGAIKEAEKRIGQLRKELGNEHS